ncbi:ABC transporter substrate-binding protein [Actinomyces sp. oral taxon 448]|jgi:ABC-type sulfonate transport system periplasmic component|uniref:ABC transporter substrate-binding protein n=1 Tax=Actinomyces sp. oral taxon 448 TaxID=712124 RepID=UPI0025C47D00|nr:MqnA/MqnD/SBP family protein [Actinomyces sp. oral taxon 448]
MIKRRSLLALTGLDLLTSAVLAACSPKGGRASADATGSQFLDALHVHTPTTLAYAAPMTSFGTYGYLDALVGEVTKDNWASVDVLKSLLLNGETDLAAVPSYVPANLFSKGVDVRLLAIQVWGMQYVIGPVGSAEQGLEALRGKTVGVPMPGNMPDLIFRYLLGQKGWNVDTDLTIQSYTDGQEALGALLTGTVEYCVLPEHPASMSLTRAQQQGKSLERTVNLQEVWASVTGGEARFPMAGLAMPTALADRSDLVGAILSELEAAVDDVNAMSEETVDAISSVNEVPADVVKEVIPRLQLQIVSGADAKDELEDFYTRLATLNPDIIGGSLPAGDLYISDPR